MSEQQTFGQYTAVKGKLDAGDSREAYVMGPALDGTIRPVASFRFYSEAVAYAKARGAGVTHDEWNAGKRA